jgi:hypothetical protein
MKGYFVELRAFPWPSTGRLLPGKAVFAELFTAD